MSLLTDLATVRRLLETDRPWAVYFLGDLAPQRLPHCTWLIAPGADPGLLLLYREFGTPVLGAVGQPAAVGPLLDTVSEPTMYLHVRPDIVDLLRPRYQIEDEADMWRMVLDSARFQAGAQTGAQRLGPAELTALQRLYADGTPTGEEPDFFFPSMLATGVFFGVWEGANLIAAAGTHLVVPEEGVAAIGNIYTRRDRRGRGLATRVTRAVTAELVARGLRTIALNVNHGNAPAIHVYERLGFARYCAFKEGVALRMS